MSDESIAPDSNISGADRETSRIIVTGPGLEDDPGYPMSASKLVRIKDNVWAWCSLITDAQFFTLEIDEAKRESFEPLSDKGILQRIMLHSQFRIYVTQVQEDYKETFYFVYSQDMQEIKKSPVILASSLDRPKEETSFTSNRFFPPAEHGTVGIVVSAGELYFYTISMLSKEAQERQKNISILLENLEK